MADRTPRVQQLDDISRAIIEHLQADGRRSYADIGKAVGLSETAVRNRVQRLVDAGVMQIVAVTDPLQLGFARQAMVGIRTSGDSTRIAAEVCVENGVDPAIFALAVGEGATIGERLLNDERIPLVSATGSCRMGRRVAEVVGKRLGRSLLELGGNNAIIVTANANMELALPAILFGSVGTAGQRCTSTRRILVHASRRKELEERLVRAYRDVRIGNPLDADTLMGPVLDPSSVDALMAAKERVVAEGGEILYGGERLEGDDYPGGRYVTPCIARAKNDFEIVQQETFAPILYIIEYGSADATGEAAVAELQEAMALHNDVPQGLSSAIFTDHIREAEYFLSHRGSDCGIANVNIGTSGAEIGGAFGGEKETGGGRESGSDAWKVYMRRQTNTVNWSTQLPLAQGISFG